MVPGVAEETANQGIPKPSGGNSRASILKSSLLMSVMTALSRLFGLLREQVQGYFLGTGMGADAFAIGSTIPNLLRRLFAEGQMTAAFVPVLKDEMVFGDRERLTRFYSGFMTLFILLMLAVTLLGIAFAEPIVRYIFAS
ncbi:MAG TPA: lipid II flippase MurJ, partial [Myxococcota bacterium]|nr:lipid II flippase MurJ [Myxococcota bacterium]